MFGLKKKTKTQNKTSSNKTEVCNSSSKGCGSKTTRNTTKSCGNKSGATRTSSK